MDFHGQLTLESWREGDFAKIRITDDGPPWPEGWKDRLFDPLLFLESQDPSKATGSAPGEKRIIDNMGGKLTRTAGGGHRKGFEVSLPVEKGFIEPRKIGPHIPGKRPELLGFFPYFFSEP
jgi:nitrogen-specific signal transduction histidine kinase